MAAAAADLKLWDNNNMALGHDGNGNFVVNLDDGVVVNNVKGATSGFIPPEFFWHETVGHQWEPVRDLDAMMAAGVDIRTAYAVIVVRKAALLINNVALNAAEVTQVHAAQYVVGNAAAALVAAPAFKSALTELANQSVSILLGVAISVTTKGHHYDKKDTMWARHQKAALGDDFWGNFNGNPDIAKEACMHHALHPVSMDQLVQIACSADPLTKPINGAQSHFLLMANGVMSKRFPATPAGTMIVRVCHALVDMIAQHRATDHLIRAVKGDAKIAGMNFWTELNDIETKIGQNPNDWNQLRPTGNTANNIKRVTRLIPVTVYLLGIAEGLELEALTPGKSEALKNAKKANPGVHTNGVAAGAFIASKAPPIDATQIELLLSRM